MRDNVQGQRSRYFGAARKYIAIYLLSSISMRMRVLEGGGGCCCALNVSLRREEAKGLIEGGNGGSSDPTHA